MKNYFDDKNKEFVINDMYPRRPWLNYYWNEKTMSFSNQFGCGDTFTMIDNQKRYIDCGERHVYIKDRETGEYYSATRNFDSLPFAVHQCYVGLGYQKIVSEYKGLRVELTLTVPNEGSVTLYKVKASNTSKQTKQTDLYFLTQTAPAITGHNAYSIADCDESLKGVLFQHIPYDVKMTYTHLYVSSEKEFQSFEVDFNRFCGVYGSTAKPCQLKNDMLEGVGVSYGSAYAGVFQYRLTLSAGEEFETVVSCGVAQNRDECIRLAKAYTSRFAFDEALRAQKEKNGAYTDVFNMQSEDAYMNSQINIWLKRQISLGKTWGRLYGKGFRDTLQDLTAFVSFDVGYAKERLLYILKHMFEDGNAIRMFEPNFRYPYNDGSTWIPATVLAYINESGDKSVLEEKIPYIKGDTKANTTYSEGMAFEDYNDICTKQTYSLFDHVQRAMDYLYGCRGKRGLVLLLGGDWNDSLNAAGKMGKGEGVWLTIATIKAHNEFIEILKIAGKEKLIPTYLARRDEMKKAVMDYGFQDGQFIYCYNDLDKKIGVAENAEAQIFLNAQTWSVLAQIADKEILNKVMDKVEEKLCCDFGYMQCQPPFKNGDNNIGRVSYFKGGNFENGSVYNHGVAFKAVADCLLGRGDLAYQTLQKISCYNPKNPNNGAEPYAVSNMYLGPDNQYMKGYAPHSWITGTAGWLYRCITEYICGVQATISGLKIQPCFPKHWNTLKVERKFRNATYYIYFERGTCNKIFVDGKEIEGKTIPIQDGKTEYQIQVFYC